MNNIHRDREMAKYCPECGEPAANEKAKFCSNCGTALPVSSPVQPSVAAPGANVAIEPAPEKRPRAGPADVPVCEDTVTDPSPDIISPRAPAGALSAEDAVENPVYGEEFSIPPAGTRSGEADAVRYTAAEKLAEAGVTWAKACINLPPDRHPVELLLATVADKLRGFLLHPARTFQKYREESFFRAFSGYIVLWIADAVLMALIVATGASRLFPYQSVPEITGTGAVIFLILVSLSGLIVPFIGGGIVHLGILIMGGKRDYLRTVRTYLYAVTPGLVLGWIPVLSLAGIVWSVILEVIGIREIQELPTRRAIGAVVCGLLVVSVVTVILAAVAAAFVFGMAGTISSSSP